MKKDEYSPGALGVQPGSRRDFLKNTAALAAMATGVRLAEAEPLGKKTIQAADAKMNGIQVGPVSFVDEGVENVLETFQKRAALNTIFLTTFTYGRGLSGRQIP